METAPSRRVHGGLAAAGQRLASRVGSRTRIWLLTLALAALSATILAGGMAWSPSPLPAFSLAVPVVAALYLLAERFPVHLVIRRDTHTFSLNEIPLVIGVFFISPIEIVLAQALGAGLALVLHRHQPPMKLAFNLANFAIGTTAAIGVFQLVLGSHDPLGPMGWLAAFAASFVADQLTGLIVVLVIWLAQGERSRLASLFGSGTLYTFVDTSLGLVAVIVVSARPESAWLLAVIGVTTLLGFRLYQDEHLKRENLAGLQESTRLVQEALDSGNATRLLLRQVRDLFNARIAELLILPGGTMPARVASLGPDDEAPDVRTAHAGSGDGIHEIAAALLAGRLVSHRTAAGVERRWLEARGFADAMIAPVRDGETARGILIAGDRMGNVGGFTAEHLSLFETLSNHAAVAIKNGYLVDRLRTESALNVHQARHDSLTELPNRTLFRERLDSVLGAGLPCAVLLIDVDRFKEVNDTLGHHNGDLVLQEMARRLAGSLAAAEVVARFSGDEFAILVAGPIAGGASIEDRAVGVARDIGAAFGAPFQVEGLSLTLGASIGISLSPEHGSTTDMLIRRADVAMYLAKRDHAEFEVYRVDRDEYSSARLALVADLRAAVEGDQLEVAYQMKVDAATGIVQGAEALVRWRHPVRGLVMPDAFIGLAEHAGLIRGLTARVLRLAVRDTVRWRRRWPDLTIAVNISPRTLIDPSLPPLVREVLAEHGLQPSALILEVTESAIVANAHRVEEALFDLDSLGCSVSIDDFGTGYSSFSYLRRLPVSELKIDREFVKGMAADEKDLAIVQLTIDLGHRLGMRVVAEGVETAANAATLRALGCDTLQGYLLSRPISNEAFIEAVAARRAEADAEAA